MRQTTCVLMTTAILCGLASTTRAGLFDWRYSWRRAQAPVSTNIATRVSSSPAKTGQLTAPSGRNGTVSVAQTAPSPSDAPQSPARRHLSLDEQRVAELGPDRARMVYPRDGETEPYPACKAWKWDSDDGWGWDWSEVNCSWRQMNIRPDFYAD